MQNEFKLQLGHTAELHTDSYRIDMEHNHLV